MEEGISVSHIWDREYGRSRIWPVSHEEIVREFSGEWLLCSALRPLEVVVRGSNCVWEISR